MSLASLAPADLTVLAELQLDRTVLLFSVAATLLASFVFGLTPALTTARASSDDPLRSAGRTD